MTDFICEVLASRHDRASFSCGEPELDDYLQRHARQDADRRVAVTYVMVPRDEPERIAGFYILSAASIRLNDLAVEFARRLPKYPFVPAILVGRLARDLRFQGLGALLLADALKRSAQHAHEVAAAVVLVDAKNDREREFYCSYGFLAIPGRTDRLFIAIRTIEKLFPEA